MKIDYDADMDRFYIPVNSGYEIQTKGKGSSFRICNTKTHVRNLVFDENLHEMLEDMARGSNAEINQLLVKNKDLQQRLALKDLEIMRLREALEDIRDGMNTKAINNTVIKSDTVYRFSEEITEALSTPTTYDDLMAWHEAQLGEPVAYNHHFIYDYDFMPEEVLSHSKEIPTVFGMKYISKTDALYAKKG